MWEEKPTIRGDKLVRIVEEVFGSKAKIRILRLLTKYPDHTFTKYRICQGTGISFITVDRHLRFLEKIGLIEGRGETAIRYAINEANGLALIVKELFQSLQKTYI